MVEVRIHIHGMADLTIAVGAQWVGVGLILPGAEVVPLPFVGVGGGILGVGAAVAGGAMDAARVIMPVALEVIIALGPSIESAVCFRRSEVDMAGKAIRLLHPGGPGLYPGQARRHSWGEVLHQPLGSGFAGIFFGKEEGEGVVFQGAVAVGAVKPGLVMDPSEKTGPALWAAGVAKGTGLGPPAAQKVGVEAVDGGGEVEQPRFAGGIQHRVRVAALAEDRLASLGHGQQIGFVEPVMHGQDVLGGGG